jgi:hypothetical protein
MLLFELQPRAQMQHFMSVAHEWGTRVCMQCYVFLQGAASHMLLLAACDSCAVVTVIVIVIVIVNACTNMSSSALPLHGLHCPW